jgi:hypothetical protein
LAQTDDSRESSQRTQIVRHFAELADQLRVAKIPGGEIAAAAERDRADEAVLTRQRLRLRDCAVRIQALDGFARRDAVFGGDERQSDVVSDLAHPLHPQSYQSFLSSGSSSLPRE